MRIAILPPVSDEDYTIWREKTSTRPSSLLCSFPISQANQQTVSRYPNAAAAAAAASLGPHAAAAGFGPIFVSLLLHNEPVRMSTFDGRRAVGTRTQASSRPAIPASQSLIRPSCARLNFLIIHIHSTTMDILRSELNRAAGTMLRRRRRRHSPQLDDVPRRRSVRQRKFHAERRRTDGLQIAVCRGELVIYRTHARARTRTDRR